MNQPAAFKATVHSLRQVPSRKICQLVLELPIEETASVAAIAEHGAWVGIARLQNPEDVRSFPSEGKGRQDMPVSSAPHSIPEGAAPATSGQEREAPSGTIPPAPFQQSDKPEKQGWGSLSYAQQAGIRAADPIFRVFLENNFSGRYNSEEAAAEFIREHCGVASRSLLSSRPNSSSGQRWAKLDRSFLGWKVADKIGAII